MNYLKKTFKAVMTNNYVWLISSVLMISSIFYSGGSADYNPTVINVSVSIFTVAMTVFSTLLARKSGALFAKIFKY